MERPILFAAIVLALSLAAIARPAAAAPEYVTVTLFEARRPTDRVEIQGPLEVVEPRRLPLPAGRFLVQCRSGRVSLRPAESSNVLAAAPRLALSAPGARAVAVRHPDAPARRYKGLVRFKAERGGKLAITNEVSARDYIQSVVGSETLPGWPAEALKCQAVLTQTRLARRLPLDQVGDSTASEAYLGADYARPAVVSAVASVWGTMLAFAGRPAAAYYHSTCAGGTSDGAKLLLLPAEQAPYLKGTACQHCRSSPFYKQHVSTVPAAVFEKRLSGGAPQVLEWDDAGRPLRLRGDSGEVTGGYRYWVKLGQSLGWDKAPGTRYRIERSRDRQHLVITSSGAGHGVGLCQWGAAGLAREGRSYREILRYYFPGATLKRW